MGITAGTIVAGNSHLTVFVLVGVTAGAIIVGSSCLTANVVIVGVPFLLEAAASPLLLMLALQLG